METTILLKLVLVAALIINFSFSQASTFTKLNFAKNDPEKRKDSNAVKKPLFDFPYFLYSKSSFVISELMNENMTPEKLSADLLSQSSEIGPIVSADGKTLYFSRHQHPLNIGGQNDDEDIWYSEWDQVNGTWGTAKNIGEPLNNQHPNFVNWVSTDGNTILLGNTYRANGIMSSGLSFSHKTATGWEFPKPLVIEGCVKQPVLSGCHLSNDQKVLVLAYENEKNTLGSNDIYVSFLKKNGHWSKPLNLGSTINTNGTETAPFISDDNRTLYFTSDGLQGLGGSDIYVSTRLDDTWQNWSEPQNLGPKVNSNTDQSFFSISDKGIYFSSENEEGNSDLFTIKFSDNKPVETNKPIISSLIEKINEELNDSTREPINFETSRCTILFDFDKSKLDKNKLQDLDILAKQLMASPNLKLELSAHTDNLGSADYNSRLSQKRLNTIVSYLKDNFEIDEKRITSINYGETRPIADNTTKEGRQLNRRVEIQIKDNLLVRN